MTAPPSRPKKNRALRTGLVVLLLALAGAGTWLTWSQLTGSNGAAAYQFASVQRGDIEDVVTATGTLQPRDYVDVGAQVSGQLKKIHVEVGSVVKEGDLLGEIDSTVYLSKVDASRAQLRNLRATLKDREAQLALARIQLRRQKALMAEDATTQESLQTAEANAKSAEASLEALRAQIEQNESSLRADEANLQYSNILSPMNGTVVSISARQGQTLNTNQSAPTILQVADLTTMTVQTQVSEADISRLRTGMDAYFTTLGGQGKRWYGKLAKIEPTPTVTNNVVLYNALFDVPNDNGELMTQMTAQVYFIVAQARDVLQVPLGALSQIRPLRPQGAGADTAGDERPAPRMRTAAEAGDGSDAGRPGRPDGERRGPRAQAGAEAGGAGEAFRRTGRGPREGMQAATGAARQATVRVLRPDNSIEERLITIGISNRVAAQVLSGLEEGDRVVAGVATAGGNQPGGQPGGNRPPMMGPGPRL
ncbi:efflux RND transporter periplasmic adaptor subunit [Thauera sp. Sel9]|uniref:efflux RND transporter periplasmic adaptor subunit n=1 Tax=Thauera sp. Sel9 TaxID=2974299 RepID=UPI0021E105F6|nr:efflux RND transporter periplasmic adaptor subunit [Thauera sp. Sel9]MCV2217358.1 efflux RND transporter periplasmic adaptor subunit [Thauera sp. Sel9]